MFTADDSGYGMALDANQSGYLPYGAFPRIVDDSHFPDLNLGNFGEAVPLPSLKGSMSNSIGSVCFTGIPSEVVNPVICSIPIRVAPDQPQRTKTYESLKNKMMNKGVRVVRKADVKIAGNVQPSFKNLRFASVASKIDSLQRTNKTEVRHLVGSLVSNDTFPLLFHKSYYRVLRIGGEE